MESKTIDDYNNEAIRDCTFDTTNIEEYTIRLGKIKLKWGRYVYDESLELEKCRDELLQAKKKALHQYKYESDLKIQGKDIDVFVDADKEFREAQKKYNIQLKKIECVENYLKVISDQSFAISSVIKHIQLTNTLGA